jgi:drug/metabolite transporter (DMT)-like permease
MLIGSLPLLALAFYVPAEPIQWTGYLLGATLYNVIACNALAWLLWLYALQHLRAGVASMISLLTPVVGVLAAWLQLHEQPTALEVAGMLLIGAGLAMLAVRVMLRHEAIEPAMAQE